MTDHLEECDDTNERFNHPCRGFEKVTMSNGLSYCGWHHLICENLAIDWIKCPYNHGIYPLPNYESFSDEDGMVEE